MNMQRKTALWDTLSTVAPTLTVFAELTRPALGRQYPLTIRFNYGLKTSAIVLTMYFIRMYSIWPPAMCHQLCISSVVFPTNFTTIPKLLRSVTTRRNQKEQQCARGKTDRHVPRAKKACAYMIFIHHTQEPHARNIGDKRKTVGRYIK